MIIYATKETMQCLLKAPYLPRGEYRQNKPRQLHFDIHTKTQGGGSTSPCVLVRVARFVAAALCAA